MPRKHEHIEWTIEKASGEFGINPRTLSARLKHLGIEPCYGGKVKRFYSTKQMAEAVYGDLEAERIRKTRAEADQIEIENEQSKKTLIDFGDFAAVWDARTVELKQIIETSGMAQEKIDLIMSKLADVLDPFKK